MRQGTGDRYSDGRYGKATYAPARSEVVAVAAAGTVEVQEPVAAAVEGILQIKRRDKRLHLLVIVVKAEFLAVVGKEKGRCEF